ncbi:MAG: hypothetical protein IPL58_05645 [Betaproteobacteria bacterium]|uniref:Uncharacterized protein n=1 Tax=Candidatus Proximibacter danicus TaxID=2954365 RepID=A0A9D7PQ11_9PROT|nr:hypothetical protein [Candidatus Proximibacter danicus]
MSVLALSAVASLLLALILGASGVFTSPAALHVAFAVGILPLIFGAMLHFVPVLTRTGAPYRLIAGLPFAAQATGVAVVLSIQGWLPRWLLHPTASIDLTLACTLLGWIVFRARRTIGTPHPGVRWYMAALFMLILALAVIPLYAAGVAPAALRLFHLHANTLGFIGLAALGTLPVLLPTALKLPDPQAAPWLRRRLLPAFAGVLLLALGAATLWPLSVLGAAFLVAIALGLLAHWSKVFGFAAVVNDGPSTSLAAALFALILLLFVGVLHASGLTSAQGMVFGFAAGFLLPLVTGALSQLLPVWRFSGVQTPERLEMRQRLARCGRLRAVVFPVAGLIFVLGQNMGGTLAMALGLGLFLADLFSALRVPPPAR